MNSYKRQHFIPCSYLKFFSHNSVWTDGRKTRVYFTDGKISRLVPVNDLGVKDFTYSKENPEFDKEFHPLEQDYPLIIERLIKRELNPKDNFKLFMIMVDLNIRNVAYKNESGVERKHVYNRLSEIFMGDITVESRWKETIEHNVSYWLEQNWIVQCIEPEITYQKFISSDNPSTVFCNTNMRPIMIYLPAHPRLGLVAYDKRYLYIKTQKISHDALSELNCLQMKRCINHIFSDIDISNDQKYWNILQNILSRDRPDRWANTKSVLSDYIKNDSDIFRGLTFIKIIPNLTDMNKTICKVLKLELSLNLPLAALFLDGFKSYKKNNSFSYRENINMKYHKRTFKDETISLDNNTFVECYFIRCKLKYSGGIPPIMKCNKFYPVPEFIFTENAGDTVNFMTSMYHGGFKNIIDEIFNL